MFNKRFLIPIYFITALLNSYGQKSTMALRQYTSENGLSDNQVTCILRDPHGFLWIGTRDGLNRFDGREFYVFKHSENNPYSICGNNIKCLELDADTLLWIGTVGSGFSSYDFRTGKFKTYTKDNSPLNSNAVNDIAFDKTKNILWLGLNHGGLQTFDLKTGSFNLHPVLISKNTYYDIEVINNTAYFAGIIESLKRIDKVQAGITTSSYYANTINKIFAASDGSIWCGAWDNGLHQFKDTARQQTYIFDGSNELKLSGDEITCMTEDANHVLWCGTKSSGIHFFDLKRRFFLNETTISPGIKSRINSIYHDNFNRIWIASETGLYVYDPLLNQFKIVELPVPGESKSCKVNDRIITQGGKEIIVTICGLFFKQPGESSYHYKKIVYRNEEQEFTSIFMDSSRQIFIGSNRTIFRLDTTTFELTIMPANKSLRNYHLFNFEGTRVNSIAQIKLHDVNYILASYYGNHIGLFDLNRRNMYELLSRSQNNVDNLSRKILIDSKQNFWICGVNNGITKVTFPENFSPLIYPMERNKVETIRLYSINWSKSVSGNVKNLTNVYDMMENADGSFWVTTTGNGLVKFYPENSSYPFISYTNHITSLQGLSRSNEDNLWMISSTGLLHFNVKNKRYKLFDVKGGFAENVSGYFFQNERNTSQLLSAGFDGGFVSFNPSKILLDMEKPSVTVSKLWIMDSASDSLLVSELKLTHDKNFIKFYLSSNCFTNNEQVTYYYRLSGIDKEWRNNENNPLITYTNLPPGNFSLAYKAVNSDGIESNVKTLALVIIPPFTQTWYFYLLVAVCASVLVYSVYRIRLNQVLKLQAVRNKIARDLHDDIGSTLGSINLFSQVAGVKLMQENIQDVKPILEKIGASSREIIDKTGDAVWAVNPANDTVENLILRMEAYAAELLGTAGIIFTITCDDNLLNVPLDMAQRKNIFLIYKEAVHNIIKYAGASKVDIMITRHSGKIQLLVKDNGKGFNKNETKAYNGNGLSNMKARATEIKGNLDIHTSDKGVSIELLF